MKIVMNPIKVYAVCDQNGNIKPISCCLEENGENIKINLELQGTEEQKVVGRIMINFFCRCLLGGCEQVIVLRYDVKEHRWYLYKI
ncbi:MAG: hypothetical protein RSB05_07360 [Clostridiales bacterium]